MNYGHQLAFNEAVCPVCDTVSKGDRDEDGTVEIRGLVRCADEDCETVLCPAGCMEHFSFVCSSCDGRFCHVHGIYVVAGDKFCGECYIAMTEQEQCECVRIDVDLEDASGCPQHGPHRRRYADGDCREPAGESAPVEQTVQSISVLKEDVPF